MDGENLSVVEPRTGQAEQTYRKQPSGSGRSLQTLRKIIDVKKWEINQAAGRDIRSHEGMQRIGIVFKSRLKQCDSMNITNNIKPLINMHFSCFIFISPPFCAPILFFMRSQTVQIFSALKFHLTAAIG